MVEVATSKPPLPEGTFVAAIVLETGIDFLVKESRLWGVFFSTESLCLRLTLADFFTVSRGVCDGFFLLLTTSSCDTLSIETRRGIGSMDFNDGANTGVGDFTAIEEHLLTGETATSRGGIISCLFESTGEVLNSSLSKER